MSESCLLSSRRKEKFSSAGSGLGAWNKPSSTSAGRCVRFSQRAHSQLPSGDGQKNCWVLSVSWGLLAEGGRGGLAVSRQRLQAGVFQAQVGPISGWGSCQERSDNVSGESLVPHTGGMILISACLSPLQAYQRWEAWTYVDIPDISLLSSPESRGLFFSMPQRAWQKKHELNGKTSEFYKTLYSE